MKVPHALVTIALLALGGCAGTPFPERSVFIGEAVRVATPDEVMNGYKQGPDRLMPAGQMASACGYNADAPTEGKMLLVRYFQYWHNVTSGIVRNGLKWAFADKGLDVAPGNMVEVELLAGKSESQCPTIRKVRAADLTTAQCEYRSNERNAVSAVLGAINPIGGPGSASIYCPYLETEGWKRVQIGPYDAFAWTRPPGGQRNDEKVGIPVDAPTSVTRDGRSPAAKPLLTPDYVSCVVKGERRQFVPTTECDP